MYRCFSYAYNMNVSNNMKYECFTMNDEMPI